ncbi:glutactin-like [Rhagoletis pomonella]|uniref:glutactin-like n=1 Tax=Rhagoletis pomonella TaxID=28610 RepID=UPI00177B3310|nr:glutactin-like [Rhagoletis pomonella]
MLLRVKRYPPFLCVHFTLVLVLSLCTAQRWPYDDYDIQGGEVETENEPSKNIGSYNLPDGSLVRPMPRLGSLPVQSDELIVPGLGVVRGKTGYKLIKGRPINSYLGVKYGVVRPGLGRFQLTNLVLYRGPVLDTIRGSYKKAPTYLYCFDYRGEFHRFGHLKNPLPFETDATLSDDNIYLFPYPEEVSNLGTQDRALSRSLVNMWTDFAAYNVPHRNNSVWPNVTTEVGPFLRIVNSNATTMELDYHFGDGLLVPNLYPEFFKNTVISNLSTTTTTTTTTTLRPHSNYPYYSNYYPNYNPSYRQNYSQYHHRPRVTVLNGPDQAMDSGREYQRYY